MKVLILGGNGYLGRTLQNYFENCSVLDFDNDLNRTINFLDYDLEKSINYDVVIDLMNPSNNLIASLYVDYFKSIFYKKKELINFLKKNDKTYVLASSAYNYYNNNNYNINSKTKAFDNYSNYLISMENTVSCSDKNLILRISSLMGVSNGYVKSGLFINEYANNNIKSIYGGETWRNFLHVSDASALIYEQIISNNKGVVNIASSNNHQLKEFLNERISLERANNMVSFATQNFCTKYNFISINDTLSELKKFYKNNTANSLVEKYRRIIG